MDQTAYVLAVARLAVNERLRALLLIAAILAVTAAVAVTFAVDTGADSPEPAPFDETVSIGLTLEDDLALDDDVELPRAQTFYSQYEYVVGYYGVETYVEAQRQAGHVERFGYPLAFT